MDEPRYDDQDAISRRRALLELGGLAVSAVGASALGAKELLGAADAEAAGAPSTPASSSSPIG